MDSWNHSMSGEFWGHFLGFCLDYAVSYSFGREHEHLDISQLIPKLHKSLPLLLMLDEKFQQAHSLDFRALRDSKPLGCSLLIAPHHSP